MGRLPRWVRLWFPTILAVVIILVTAFAALAVWPRTPGDNSAEAGFLRDMIMHHNQAVEMSLIVLPKTEDERIRFLAIDILTLQQSQVGMMSGWLDLWDLRQTGTQGVMAWMGHEVEGLMPGLATREQLDLLRELPPDEADRYFLQLMIVHHRAALDMGNAALERASEDNVREFADRVVTSQTAEITLMELFLEERGGPLAPDETEAAVPGATPIATPDADHTHDD